MRAVGPRAAERQLCRSLHEGEERKREKRRLDCNERLRRQVAELGEREAARLREGEAARLRERPFI